MLEEVLPDVSVQLVESKRVPGAGTDVVIPRLPDLGLCGADGKDCVHHVIAWHDVDNRIRGRRKLRQLAAAIGQNQRLGHLEAFDPSRMGMAPRRLDDGGTNY